jgi:hypothetical protein
MLKEVILIFVVIFSFVLIVLAIKRLNTLNLSKGTKRGLYYLTLLVPILGFFLIKSIKENNKS